MNIISITGNVGKDAELKEFVENKLLTFSVADSQYKEKTVWFRCKLWGKRADSLRDKILKGTMLHVIGEMTSSEYEKDGTKVQSWEVNVRDVHIVKWSENYESEAPF